MCLLISMMSRSKLLSQRVSVLEVSRDKDVDADYQPVSVILLEFLTAGTHTL